MKVCIAEKPSVAGDIARILGAKTKKNGYWEGNGYQVTWTFGHLCTLKMPDDYRPEWKRWTLESLPMLPEKFEIKLIQTKNKKASSGIKSQFAIIKKLFQKATEIINCGDAGQEGELIQRWVLQHTRCRKPVKRLWISSLTKEAIRNGFRNLQPASQYDALFAAGRSRAIGDWLLGMNASRLYTLKYGGYKQLLSIGRVQTPTLALIVKRNHEIENFKPETYWELHTNYRNAKFQSEKGKFKKKEEGEKCFNQVKDKPFTIFSVSQKKAKEKPPYLFDLTSLQIHANKRFGYSADFTLQQIQKLYEKKLVTYPRVDTTYLPNDMYGKIKGILSKMTDYQEFTQSLLNKPISKSKKVFNSTKVTDHHAIIPTGVSPKSLSYGEKNIYDAISRRFIAAFYPDCLVNHTTVIGEAGGIKFKATGKQILEAGWRVLYPKKESKTATNKTENSVAKGKKASAKKKKEERILPIFKQGESGEHKPELLEKQTQPPKDYTEATLLQGMETAGKTVEDEALRALMKANGIGRPSTRANIIETLCRRNYIRRAKKKLLPTTTGKELIGVIKNNLLKSAELTGKWEAKLRDIEDGKYSEQQFLSEMENMIKQMVQEVLEDKTYRKIAATDSQNNYKKGNFKEKKSFQIGTEKGKKREATASNLKAQTTRKASKTTIQKDTKTQKNELVNCPKCQQGFILKGKMAYGCSNYKSGCDFVVPFVFHKKKLSENQVFTLIKKGKSRLLKGFVSDGQKIAARVVLDDDCYISLEVAESKEEATKTQKASTEKFETATKKVAKNENPFCPKCKKGHIVKGKTAYGCSLWKGGCDFRFSFALIREKAAGRVLTKDLVMEIIGS